MRRIVGLVLAVSAGLALYEYLRRKTRAGSVLDDPLLGLRGSGKDLWRDEPADVYVERLR